jgi:hypothetical protein
MGLHIEISGECSPREWQALAAVAAIMLGETAISSGVVPIPPAPVSTAKIGTDADRPAIPVAVPVATVPVPPVDTPPVPASEALLQAEAARVVPPAPTTPAAPPPGVDVDATGLPWDARIHASTKTKKGDQTWTAKRGVDKALVDQVTAELKAIMAAPVPPVAKTSVPVAPVVTDPAAAFGAGAAPPAAPAPAPTPPVDAVPAAPAAPESDAGMGEFARVMRVVVAKQAAGGLSTEMTTGIAQQLGLTGVRDLAKRPDLIPAFEALLP